MIKTTSQNFYLFLKQYWFFVLIFIVIVVVVAVIVIFSLKKPEANRQYLSPTPIPAPQETMPDQSSTQQILQPTSLNTDYSGAKYSVSFTDLLPVSMQTVIKSNSPLDNNQLAGLASDFGLHEPSKTIDTSIIYSSPNQETFLNIDTQTGFVNYTNAAPSEKLDSQDSATIISPTQVLTNAKNLINKYKIPANHVDFNKPTVEYILNYSETPSVTDDFTKANYFLISYPSEINGIGLYKQFGETINTTIVFDRLNNVKQLTFYVFNISNGQEKTTLITTQQFKDLLLQGKGTVRQPFDVSNNEASTQPLFTLTHAQPGYLMDSTSQYLVPIFIATGEVAMGSSNRDAVVYSIATK